MSRKSEPTPAEPTDKPPCLPGMAHHIDMATPNGASVLGTCRNCGWAREYVTASQFSGYDFELTRDPRRNNYRRPEFYRPEVLG